MSKRKIILTLIAIAIALILALVEVNATEYRVLNQGDRPACMVYAVETCIDVVGEPSSIGVDKAYKDFGKDSTDAKSVLDYYVTNGAITGYEKVEEITDFPVIIITWMDMTDWRDGYHRAKKALYESPRHGANREGGRLLRRRKLLGRKMGICRTLQAV